MAPKPTLSALEIAIRLNLIPEKYFLTLKDLSKHPAEEMVRDSLVTSMAYVAEEQLQNLWSAITLPPEERNEEKIGELTRELQGVWDQYVADAMDIYDNSPHLNEDIMFMEGAPTWPAK